MTAPWDVLAIPSRSRSDRIGSMTLTALQDAGCSLDNVEIWVRPEQADDYRTALAGWPVTIRPDSPSHGGVREVRNAIARGYPNGTRLLSMDDDIRSFVGLGDGPPDLAGALTYAWIECRRRRVGLFGLYPVANPYFMKHRTRLGLQFIDGTVFGFTVQGDDCELVTLDEKEDYQRSIEFWLRDRATLRLEWLSFRSAFMTEPGGMQEYRDPTMAEGAAAIRALYPDLTRPPVRSKSRGQWEVKLRTMKAQHLPTPDGLR